MSELMENNCKTTFICTGQDECVYRFGKPCKYLFCMECTSQVARVNRLVLELQSLGFETNLTVKGVE